MNRELGTGKQLTHDSDISLTSGDELPTRLLKKIIGRQVEQSIVDADEHVLLHSGDVVTPEAVALAREAGVLRQLLNSATEECCVARTAGCTRADIW